MRRYPMNKETAVGEFRSLILPDIQAHYEQDGIPDRPARREAWNNYVDELLRDRRVSPAAEHWTHPRGLETWKD